MLLFLVIACSTRPYVAQTTSEDLAAWQHDDGDAIIGDADKCPRAAEDEDGFQDDDGCPDPDNDGDGFPDLADACPDEKGGEPNVLDSMDGCKPFIDKDNDGISIPEDQCPLRPENFNDYKDDDGCPDVKVEVTKDRITFEGKVLFATGTADVKAESFDLLQALADILAENPQIKRVEVGGHTDDVGTSSANLKLSKARAAAVKAKLVELGVEDARLIARGYGESKPIVNDTTEEARAANRRVELLIK